MEADGNISASLALCAGNSPVTVLVRMTKFLSIAKDGWIVPV